MIQVKNSFFDREGAEVGLGVAAVEAVEIA